MSKINKNKIKAVIFDWGGVCCKEGEPFASKALQDILGKNPDQIVADVRKIYNGYYVGQYDSESFWRNIIQHYGLSEGEQINPASLSQAYLHSYEIYPEVLNVALKLQKKYKVSLLSNLTPEMRNDIRQKYNIAQYFPIEIYSCDDDIKLMKPDINIFKIIADRMGVEPVECLFIDNSKTNIEAAALLGMSTLLFKSVDVFLEEINRIL